MRLVRTLGAAFIVSMGMLAACGGSGGGSGGGGAGGDSSTATGGAAGDAALPDGAAGTGAAPDATADAGNDSACSCSTTQKCCGTSCVSITDTAYGCAQPGCAPCSLAHATAKCLGGSCAIAACDTGWGDCNTSAADGCETDTSTSVDNCGACGKTCAAIHGSAACTNGTCALTCDAGFDDCDQDPTNGCEADLLSSVANCGACGAPCAAQTSNGTGACTNGQCILTCNSGFDDCNNNVLDGCEVDLSDNVSNCGSCGNGCTTSLPNAVAACKGASCSFSCTAGFGNCDGNDANGCEHDLSADSANCGACGHDCLGTTCAYGVCGSETLSNTSNRARGIAIDATDVYWADGGTPGGVFKIAKTGGTVTSLYTAEPVNALAIDSTDVYFPTASGVYRVAKTGGTPVQLGTGAGTFDIALDGSNIYVAGSASVMVLPKSGGTPTALAGSVTTSFLAFDATYVYWSGDGPSATGEVRRVPKAGGTSEILYSLGSHDVRQLAVAGGFVYFLTQWGVNKVAVTGSSTQELFSTTDSGGNAVMARGIAVDNGQVFWGTEYGYKLERGSIDGTNRTTMATATVWDIALDTSYVYYTSGFSAVSRVAR